MPIHRVKLIALMKNGDEFPFTVTNASMTSWDRDRARHGWPGPGDAPSIWMNYLAWHHLTKVADKLPAMSLAEFEQACEAMGDGSQPDEAPADVDPTNQGLEHG